KVLLVNTLLNPYFCFSNYHDDSINHTHEFEDYDFIALVKIKDIRNYKEPTNNYFTGVSILTVNILELFKGKHVNEVFEYLTMTTSCEIRIIKGEEWIIFGNIESNKIVTTNCTANVLYKDTNEIRDW